MGHHFFEATQSKVILHLEDKYGARIGAREVVVWFADTSLVLLGMQDLLDDAIIHIDFPNLSGYLEFDE